MPMPLNLGPRNVDRVYRSCNVWFDASGSQLSTKLCDIFIAVNGADLVPLCMSTVHSAMEAQFECAKTIYSDIYLHPRTTIPFTGLFGTSHNNSYIDMCPGEQEKVPDIYARQSKDEHIRFICALHTSHSYKAGKSSHMAQDVIVR